MPYTTTDLAFYTLNVVLDIPLTYHVFNNALLHRTSQTYVLLTSDKLMLARFTEQNLEKAKH